MTRTVPELRQIVERRRNRINDKLNQLRANGVANPEIEEERDLCDVLDFLLEEVTRKKIQ